MRKDPFLWRLEDWVHAHPKTGVVVFGVIAGLLLVGIAWGAVQIIGWLL